MEIILYSLPHCGICNMVKKKLTEKHINYIEKDFSEIADEIHSDHAPALKICNEQNEAFIITSPVYIVQWINE